MIPHREPAAGHQWHTVVLRLPDGGLLGQQYLARSQAEAERHALGQYPGARVERDPLQQRGDPTCP